MLLALLGEFWLESVALSWGGPELGPYSDRFRHIHEIMLFVAVLPDVAQCWRLPPWIQAPMLLLLPLPLPQFLALRLRHSAQILPRAKHALLTSPVRGATRSPCATMASSGVNRPLVAPLTSSGCSASVRERLCFFRRFVSLMRAVNGMYLFYGALGVLGLILLVILICICKCCCCSRRRKVVHAARMEVLGDGAAEPLIRSTPKTGNAYTLCVRARVRVRVRVLMHGRCTSRGDAQEVVACGQSVKASKIENLFKNKSPFFESKSHCGLC
jgi:hypothetical protein